jgi:3'-phosphoadenosine 5'-phosphosulfate sulfotransferase (PAPS reductase)/FAD synthetase
MSDPYKIIEPTVISFSGGRTSGYMLWRVLQSNNGLPNDAKVIFANTGKEEEATLKFINDCATKWNVPIVWLEYLPENPKFKKVTFENASRNGEPFEALIKKKNYLPNTVARFCTQELKVLAVDRYLKSIGINEYQTFLGIRADEPRRVAKMANQDGKLTPLAKDNISEQIVWDFWNKNNFDLELAKVSGASNCDLCFLKGTKILAGLIQQNPKRADWWVKMENHVGARFSKDKPTYAQMLKFNNDQMNMFEDQTISCFCGD